MLIVSTKMGLVPYIWLLGKATEKSYLYYYSMELMFIASPIMETVPYM
jgi:hypothetical protein